MEDGHEGGGLGEGLKGAVMSRYAFCFSRRVHSMVL